MVTAIILAVLEVITLYLILRNNIKVDINLPAKLGLDETSTFTILNEDTNRVVRFEKGKVTETSIKQAENTKQEATFKVREATEQYSKNLVSFVMASAFEDLDSPILEKIGAATALFVATKSIGDFLPE